MTRATWTFARLTVLEAARRRLLRVLALLTLASVGVTGWGIERLVTLARDHGASAAEVDYGVAQLLVFAAFMFSFVLAATAAFLAAPAIAGDLESGTALAVFARPVARADLVIGTWLGLGLVVAGYAFASGLLEIAAVGWFAGYLPPHPVEAVLCLVGEALVLMTLALLLSTRMSAIAGGAVAVVAFGLAWMLGVLGGLGKALEVDALVRAADVGRLVLPTDLLWRGVSDALQPPPQTILEAIGRAAAGVANPFGGGSPPGVGGVAWAVGWVAVVLGLAAWSLGRREV